MEEGRTRIKIIEVSGKDCKPCEELQNEIRSLGSKYDIDLVVVDIEDFSKEEIVAAFGEIKGVPTTIIEAEGKAEKIVGYKQGEITEVVKKILKPEEG